MAFQLVLLFAFCGFHLVFGQYQSFNAYSRYRYPNPMKDPAVCGRGRVQKSYVCDPDLILGSQDTEASQLDGLITKIINETACPCSAYSCEHHRGGYKIGIALTNQMKIEDDKSLQDDDIEEGEAKKMRIMKSLDNAQLYANEIQKKWNLGHCAEDVIIFYSLTDNVVYTVTGDVARTKLTNMLVAKIAKEARHTGFNKSPFEGLWKIVNDYRAVFLNSYHLREPKKEELKGQNVAASSSGCLLFFVFSLVVALYGIFERM